MISLLLPLLAVLQAAPATPSATAKPAPAKPAALTPEVRSLVERMQAFYEKTTDFTADFTQRYQYQASRRTQVSSGTVKFKKPGLMRWDYLEPSKRTFLLTGDKAYALDLEALTLTRSPFDQSQLSAAVTFLFGKGNLLEEFSITRVECETCKGVVLELLPKVSSPRFDRLRLEVDAKTAQVLQTQVIDPDGSVNTITFNHLRTDVGLSDAQFKLTPPPNTQILDMGR